MAYADEAIIRLQAETEQRQRASDIDLSKEQILYGEAYQFEAQQFFGDRLEIWVPRQFIPMPENVVNEKYLAAEKPQVILTNRECAVDISLNLLEDQLKVEQIPSCLQKLMNTIRNVFPATLFFDCEQIEIDDAVIAYMDFKCFSLDSPVYHVMFVSSIHGRPLIGSFNCPFEQWEQWKPVVFEMLKTVREMEIR